MKWTNRGAGRQLRAGPLGQTHREVGNRWPHTSSPATSPHHRIHRGRLPHQRARQRRPRLEPDRIEGTGRILVPFLARPHLWGANGRPAPDRGHARGHRPGRRHRLDSTGRCHTVAPAATSRPSSHGPTADWSPGRPSPRYGLACPPSRARHRGPRPGPAGVLARRCDRPGHAGAARRTRHRGRLHQHDESRRPVGRQSRPARRCRRPTGLRARHRAR